MSLLYFILYVTDIFYEGKTHIGWQKISLSLWSLSLPLLFSLLPMAPVLDGWGPLYSGVTEHSGIKPLSQRTVLLKHMLFWYFLLFSGHRLCHLRTERALLQRLVPSIETWPKELLILFSQECQTLSAWGSQSISYAQCFPNKNFLFLLHKVVCIDLIKYICLFECSLLNFCHHHYAPGAGGDPQDGIPPPSWLEHHSALSTIYLWLRAFWLFSFFFSCIYAFHTLIILYFFWHKKRKVEFSIWKEKVICICLIYMHSCEFPNEYLLDYFSLETREKILK